ncbi:hypothetical protein TKK_0014992 [Trichogramma kaykai]|uniref:Serpin domain-containing protein n=1 Tax=Trichogramma kaykai TaxID=54128 RepID=A0ABD2WC80_9HYME
MKYFALTALLLVQLTTMMASCQEQGFVYPDAFEMMKLQAEEEAENQRLQSYPSGARPNELNSNSNNNGNYWARPGAPGNHPVGQFASFAPVAASAAPPPPPPGSVGPASSSALAPNRPPAQQQSGATPFDNFLPPRWRDHVLNLISRGITKFALDLDRVIEQTSEVSTENRVFSPASLTLTLSMVLLAAGGKTFDEVSKILGLESGIDVSKHSEIVHQIFGLSIRETLKKEQLDPTLPRSNFGFGIFVENGYPIREQFRAVSENVYKADVVNVDFSRDNKAAQRLINNWVNNRTAGLIKSLLSEPPSPLTKVIITSALYFMGEWEQHFVEESTRRKPFFTEPNQSVLVDLMYNGGEFPYHEDAQLGLKIISFPYKGRELSMYAILPDKQGTAGLREMRSKLNPEIIESLIDKMRNQSCIIGFPRMKLSSTLGLQGALKALGLHSLFDPATADLSVLSGGPGSKQPQQQQQQQQPRQQQQPASVNYSPTFQPAAAPASAVNYSSQKFQPASAPASFAPSFQSYAASYQPAPASVSALIRPQPYAQTYQSAPRPQPVSQLLQAPPLAVPASAPLPQQQQYGQAQARAQGGFKPGGSINRSSDAQSRYFRQQQQTNNVWQPRRWKRQNRPIDQEFLNFVNSQKLPTFGVDELRNTPGLTNPGIWADDVLHKVEMVVNERGTEAAAATSILLDRTGNFKRFIANRPFVFFIRHDASKSIWFWATINRPDPFYVGKDSP